MKSPSESLSDKLGRIKASHHKAIQETVARTVLGPSVIRVFLPGTKKKLQPFLAGMDLRRLPEFKSQKKFNDWYEKGLDELTQIVRKTNRGNTRIEPGLQWGHCTKVLSVFLKCIVLKSRYFSDAEVKTISPFLHAPVDGIVIRELKKCGIALPFHQIKGLKSREMFYHVQQMIGDAADHHKIPRVWFDDVWGDRDAE